MNKRVLQARAQALSPHWHDVQGDIQLRTGAISSPRPAGEKEEIVQDIAVIDTSGTLSVWQTKVRRKEYHCSSSIHPVPCDEPALASPCSRNILKLTV